MKLTLLMMVLFISSTVFSQRKPIDRRVSQCEAKPIRFKMDPRYNASVARHLRTYGTYRSKNKKRVKARMTAKKNCEKTWYKCRVRCYKSFN